MVGWAGSALAARFLLGELRKGAGSIRTAAVLDEVLEAIFANLGGLHLDVVGFLQTDDGQLSAFGKGFGVQRLPLAESMVGFVAGSGARAIVPSIGDLLRADSFKATEGAPDDDEICVAKAVGIAGLLLQLELATQNSLRELYGGCYEVATLTPDGFRKVDNVGFIFFRARLAVERFSFDGPDAIMKLTYRDDDLVVRSLLLSPDDQGRKALRDTCHLIPPIDATHKITNFSYSEWPPLESNLLCRYIITALHTGDIVILTKISQRENTHDFLTYRPSLTNPRLELNKNLFAEMCAELQAKAPPDAKWRLAL